MSFKLVFKKIEKYKDYLNTNAEEFKKNLTDENNLKLRDCITGIYVLSNLKAKLEHNKSKLEDNIIIEEFLEELYSKYGIETLKAKNYIEEIEKKIKEIDEKTNGVLTYEYKFYSALLDHLKPNFAEYYKALLNMHYDFFKEFPQYLKELGVKSLDEYLEGS